MARKEVDEWFWQIGTELQRLSEEMLRAGPTLVSRKFWEPRLDVFEDHECLVVKAEIAGVRAQDLQLIYNPDRNSLIIRGVRQEGNAPAPKRTGCYQLEIFYGEFEREVTLPDLALDPSGIKARFRDGFLMVHIPKRENIV